MAIGVQERRAEQVEVEFPQQVQALIKSLNDQVKWNFVVRYLAKTAIKAADKESFFSWVQTPGQSIGGMSSEFSFELPGPVSECASRVHALARQILLPKGEHTDRDLQSLFDKLQEYSDQIHVLPFDQRGKLGEEILDNIYRSSGCRLEVSEADQELFIGRLSCLFSERENQKLCDEEIDQKVKGIFVELEVDPQISPGRLGSFIRSLWAFPQEGAQNVLTDLSEFFVNHNPYNMTAEEVFADILVHGDKDRLLGKSVIYRLPNRPVSLTVAKVDVSFAPGAAVGIITLRSEENLSMSLIVNVGKKQITTLSFDRVKLTDLGRFVKKGERLPAASFEVAMKMPIVGIENPFEVGKHYQQKVETGSERIPWSTRHAKYVDYKFIPDNGKEVVIRVINGESKIRVTVGEEKFDQDMPWDTYQSLFEVQTVGVETYTSIAVGEASLDTRLVALSSKPLATEGAIKKALKERDLWKVSILSNLLEEERLNKDGAVAKAFRHQVKEPQELLPDDLFNEIFNRSPAFQRLCANQYVKAEYVGEGELMTAPMKKQFAGDLLQEAQMCLLARVEPKSLQGNQDLIKELSKATRLAAEMQGKFAIPFSGSTGSGKSTAVGYAMGVPMEEFRDNFGEMRIRHKEVGEGRPKIGFALGISETIHASSYSLLPPPPFVNDPRNPFAVAPRHYPEFKNELTQENVTLVDFPGFFDTRGTHYEVITNFSIDRAMEAFKSVPGLVVVVPYENVTADRARMLYGTLTDLEAKFPELLENEKLQKRIHFVITKFRDIGKDQIKLRLEQLADEYREDGLAGAKYFAFLLNQLLKGNVHLLNPLSTATRLELLNKIIDGFNPHVEDPVKDSYKGSFQDARMQLRIGDVLHGAVICWKNLLEGFRDLEKFLSQVNDRLGGLHASIIAAVVDKEAKEARLLQLEGMRGQPFNTDDPVIKEMLASIGDNSETTMKRLRDANRDLENEIANLVAHISTCQEAIGQIDVQIRDLSTGIIDVSLHNQVNNKGDQKKYGGYWKISPAEIEAKIRRQIDSGADCLSEHEGEMEDNPHVREVGKESWTFKTSFVLQKSYELVPHDLDEAQKVLKLNALADGKGLRSVILNDGSGWRIDVESSGTIKFYGIRAHDSGKKLLYGYEEAFNLAPPYPKLVIRAVLPKSNYNRMSIESLRAESRRWSDEIDRANSTKAVKEGVLAANVVEIERLERLLAADLRSSLEALIDGAKEDLAIANDRLDSLNAQFDALKKEKERAEWGLRSHAVSIQHNREIIQGTYSCSQGFKVTDNNDLGGMVQKKGAEVFAECQNFLKIYSTHFTQIERKVAEILN